MLSRMMLKMRLTIEQCEFGSFLRLEELIASEKNISHNHPKHVQMSIGVGDESR